MGSKEYIYKISEYIARRDDLDIIVYPYYFLGYYNSFLFKTKIRQFNIKYKINELLVPWRSIAFTNTDDIHVFLRHFLLPKNRKYIVRYLTHSIAHEIGHVYQEQKLSDYSIEEQYIFKLENFLVDNNFEFNNHYDEYHDNYLLEIDADLYGSTRGEEILKIIKAPQEDIDFMQASILEAKLRKENYDFKFILEEIIRILRLHPEVAQDNYEELSPLPLLYLKEDLTFESIENIIYIDENVKQDMTHVSRMIMTSEIFLKELDLNSLSSREIRYLEIALEAQILVENSKKEYNKQQFEHRCLDQEFIKREIGAADYYIDLYNNYLKELENIKESKKRL